MQGSETRTITESDRLKLIGLLALAAEINRDHDRVTRAVAGLLGESDNNGDGDFGHVSDAVSEAGTGSPYGDPSRLLRCLEIEVVSDAG